MAGVDGSAFRYTRGAIAFHWSIAALTIANLALGLFHDSLLDGIGSVMPVHKSIGLTVLALTIGRIAWRLAHPAPPLPSNVAGWEKGAAHVTHFAMYTLMLLLPLTGWLLSSNPERLRPFTWFGLFTVPFLPASAAGSATADSAHGLLGWMMMVLLVLHIGTALRHHLILKDRVLARMLPGV